MEFPGKITAATQVLMDGTRQGRLVQQASLSDALCVRIAKQHFPQWLPVPLFDGKAEALFGAVEYRFRKALCQHALEDLFSAGLHICVATPLQSLLHKSMVQEGAACFETDSHTRPIHLWQDISLQICLHISQHPSL